MIESSKAVAPWRQAVAWSAKEAIGEQKAIQTPCSVTITFFLKQPKKPKFKDHPATRPDLDKLVRSTLDGLVFGGAIADDSLVVDLRTCKRWSDGSNLPGASIFVWDTDVG